MVSLTDLSLPGPTIFFDDSCLVCNGFVRFLLKQDKGRKRFYFSSLQAPQNKTIRQYLYDRLGAKETIAFVQGDRIDTQSTAILRILQHLGQGWQGFYVLMLVPTVIRDFCYDWFSKNRYWLGKKESSCMLLGKEEQQYFID